MNITLQPEVFSRVHPKFKLALILATQLDNKSKRQESLHLLGEAEKLIRLTFNKETVKNHYLISPWSVAQQEFGKQAKHYHTSVERLLQDILDKKNIAAAEVVTNIVRYLSLKHLIPLAVDDAAKIKGSVTFAIARRSKQKARKGELYYHDEQQMLGTKLDFWKNKATALTLTSTAALIHLEALPPVTSRKLKEIVAELEHLLYIFCKAITKTTILKQAKNKARL